MTGKVVRGLLSDDSRDWIAIASLVLSLTQTCLALIAIRARSRRLIASPIPITTDEAIQRQPSPEFGLGTVACLIGASLFLGLASFSGSFWALQTTTALGQRLAEFFVSMSALFCVLCFVVGVFLVIDWSQATQSVAAFRILATTIAVVWLALSVAAIVLFHSNLSPDMPAEWARDTGNLFAGLVILTNVCGVGSFIFVYLEEWTAARGLTHKG